MRHTRFQYKSLAESQKTLIEWANTFLRFLQCRFYIFKRMTYMCMSFPRKYVILNAYQKQFVYHAKCF